MLIKIGNFEFTSVWDGVFYKKLSQYPKILDWESRQINFEKGNLKAIFLKSLLYGYFILRLFHPIKLESFNPIK